MRLPQLFNREKSSAARRERQDELDRVLTEGLRVLSKLFGTMADKVERQRLERKGFESQGAFLERHDSKR